MSELVNYRQEETRAETVSIDEIPASRRGGDTRTIKDPIKIKTLNSLPVLLTGKSALKFNFPTLIRQRTKRLILEHGLKERE